MKKMIIGLLTSTLLILSVTSVNALDNEPPVASFIYDPINPITHEMIQFTDTSTDTDGTIVSWWWDFGDNYFSNLQNPMHCYHIDGTYLVSLTVTDNDGAQTTIQQAIVVFTPANQAPNTPSKPSGLKLGFVNMFLIYTTNTTDPNGDLVYYQWNWGDGSMSDWIGPAGSGVLVGAFHIWKTKGTYQVKVKAKDSNGAESDWSPSLTVKIIKGQ